MSQAKPMGEDITRIFDDLESYKKFCVQFGWVFDEKGLYNKNNKSWENYLKFKDGKRVPNNWVKDQKRRKSRR
jgi:hypothetical protein